VAEGSMLTDAPIMRGTTATMLFQVMEARAGKLMWRTENAERMLIALSNLVLSSGSFGLAGNLWNWIQTIDPEGLLNHEKIPNIFLFF
jgi:hypothetical protein